MRLEKESHMDEPSRADDQSAYFELSFSPNVNLVSTVRRFVSDFWTQILPSAEVTSQLAVATHELLDNAVAYSFDSNTHVPIDVVKEKGGTASVNIGTRNRASIDNIGRVREALDELASATDAFAFYQEMMRKAGERVDGSGL